MSTDRSAVVSAINSTSNLGEAARKLGASRRTLQNRMRDYGIPRGQAGRPKEWLPYKSGSAIKTVLGVGAAVVGLVFVGRWLREKESHIAGDTSPLAGLIAERK
jgi:hypothetical protein